MKNTFSIWKKSFHQNSTEGNLFKCKTVFTQIMISSKLPLQLYIIPSIKLLKAFFLYIYNINYSLFNLSFYSTFDIFSYRSEIIGSSCALR